MKIVIHGGENTVSIYAINIKLTEFINFDFCGKLYDYQSWKLQPKVKIAFSFENELC